MQRQIIGRLNARKVAARELAEARAKNADAAKVQQEKTKRILKENPDLVLVDRRSVGLKPKIMKRRPERQNGMRHAWQRKAARGRV